MADAADARKRWDTDDRFTGVPGDSGPFATHGHTLRLTLRPQATP
jgi:hypothetical protein